MRSSPRSGAFPSQQGRSHRCRGQSPFLARHKPERAASRSEGPQRKHPRWEAHAKHHTCVGQN
eukprot:13891536-Alexandrium_andersonii.AAC.1